MEEAKKVILCHGHSSFIPLLILLSYGLCFLHDRDIVSMPCPPILVHYGMSHDRMVNSRRVIMEDSQSAGDFEAFDGMARLFG